MATKTAAVKAKGRKRAPKPKSLRELFSSQRRWMQGEMRNGRGAYCLIGGLDRVYGWHASGTYVSARERLINAIAAEAGPYVSIVTYNDDPNRTFADIKRIVRKARV